MKINTIFIDMDGVLVNFVDGVFKAMEIEDWEVIPGEWKIAKWKNVGSDFWDRFYEHITYDVWANLEPYEWMDDIVSLAVRLVGKENVFILTSPTIEGPSAQGKTSFVRKHLGKYFATRMIITPHKYLCAAPDRLLLDDSDKKLQKFVAFGGKGCLIPMPWNSLHNVCMGKPHTEFNPMGYLKRYLVEREWFDYDTVYGTINK